MIVSTGTGHTRFGQARFGVRLAPWAEAGFSEPEWKKVQAWRKRNQLNRFGDPKGTKYPNPQGSPLQGSQTLADYLRQNHPTQPWL